MIIVDCPHIDCGAKAGHPCVEVRVGSHSELGLKNKLTAMEQKVILCLANAHNNESISNQLGITINTAKRHIYNISNKIGVNSRLEIAVWFYQTNYEPKR